MSKDKTEKNTIEQINWKTVQGRLKQYGKNFEKTVINYKDLNIPDPILHKYLSFVKSGLRIVGCGVGIAGLFIPGFVFLLVAEIVGIVEEMV